MMNLNQSAPDDAKWQLQDLLSELEGESDRAAAIVGAAWMDGILAELLSLSLIDHKESKDLLKGTLGLYLRRVKVAFCLGIITDSEKSDLETIGEIRNLFAHKIHRSSFNNSKVHTLCRKLHLGSRFVTKPNSATPRELFNASVSVLAYNLGNVKERLRVKKPAIPDREGILGGQVAA
jgi:hypothetical protein